MSVGTTVAVERTRATTSDVAVVSRRLTPYQVIMAWWCLTIGLFLINWPLKYTRPNLLLVTCLWLACIGAGILGYRWVMGNAPKLNSITSFGNDEESVPHSKVAAIGLIASIAILPTAVVTYTGFAITDFSTLIGNARFAYYSTGMVLQQDPSSRLQTTVLFAVVNVLGMLALPYYCARWFRYRRGGLLVLASLIPFLFLAVFSGRDYSLGLALTIIMVSALAGLRGRIQWGRRTTIISLMALVGLAALVGARRLSRATSDVITSFVPVTCQLGTVCDSAPEPGPFDFIAPYSTQGFQGLGIALDARWDSMLGLGHSLPLARVFGADLSAAVTTQLDSMGWSSTGFWSTGLTPIANDVPWILVPLVIFLIWALFALAWKESIGPQLNPLALAVVAYTGFLLAFMPQNLTLAVDGPKYVAYLAVTLAFLTYLLARAAVNARQRSADA